MLAGMVDYPVSEKQSVLTVVDGKDWRAPYLSHSLVHSPLLGLLDGNLKSLRLARAFWIGWRIANGAVWSRIHLISTNFSSCTLAHCRTRLGGLRNVRCCHSSHFQRRMRVGFDVRAVSRKAGGEAGGWMIKYRAVTSDRLHDERRGTQATGIG